MQAQEEIDLVRRLTQGDRDAFTSLFRRYGKMLYVQAYTKCKNEKDAEDLVQEIFAQLWDKRMSVDPNRPVHTYLWVSLRNAIINRYKKSLHSDLYIKEQLSDEQNANPFEGIDLKDQIVKAIDQLTNPKAKVVIHKFYYEGKSYKDIEAETGIAVPTSKKIVLRSLTSLRKMIKFR